MSAVQVRELPEDFSNPVQGLLQTPSNEIEKAATLTLLIGSSVFESFNFMLNGPYQRTSQGRYQVGPRQSESRTESPRMVCQICYRPPSKEEIRP
jgi:hypothetical protein